MSSGTELESDFLLMNRPSFQNMSSTHTTPQHGPHRVEGAIHQHKDAPDFHPQTCVSWQTDRMMQDREGQIREMEAYGDIKQAERQMTFSQTWRQLHKPTLNSPKWMCNLKSDKYGRPAGQTDASESERTHQTRRTAFRDVNNWTTETPLRMS